MYRKDIKTVIDYGRTWSRKEKKAYSNEAVIQGMGTVKELYRMESGDMAMEKLLLDRILHRVGLDSDMMEMMLSNEDVERYKKRIQIFQCYEAKEYEKMGQLLLEYQEETNQCSVLHQQFVQVMKAKWMSKTKQNWNDIVKILTQALQYTVRDWETSAPESLCLAWEELEIIVLLAICYRKKRMYRKALYYLQWVLQYSKTHKMEKELRPKFLALTYLELSKITHDWDALYYAKSGILLLYESACINYLIPLQNRYLYLLGEIERRKGLTKKQRRDGRRLQEERDVLLQLAKEVNVGIEEKEPIPIYKNAYLISETLRRYRNYLGLSQEEFCEGVCSQVAYSKIETGTVVPKRTFPKLMERVGLPSAYAITALHGVPKNYMDQKVEINRSLRQYQYKEAKRSMQQLEEVLRRKRLVENCPRNHQFILMTNAIIEKAVGKISSEEKRNQLILALQQTIPEYPSKDLSKRMLLWQEAMILNNIADTYMEYEDYERAIEIWEMVQNSYKCSKLYGFVEYEGYDLMQANYASCIGSSGSYSQSTKLCYENIRHCLKEGNIEFLERACYGIAWNREQEIKQRYRELKKETAYLEKLRQAEVIANMLKQKFAIEFLKRHREMLDKINH